jgi:hypothetical protein
VTTIAVKGTGSSSPIAAAMPPISAAASMVLPISTPISAGYSTQRGK